MNLQEAALEDFKNLAFIFQTGCCWDGRRIASLKIGLRMRCVETSYTLRST